MKRVIVSVLIVVLIVSCSKKNDEPIGFVLSTSFYYNVLNIEGEDLLNPINSGYFPFEDMRLYYIINNEKIEVYDTLMSSPRNIGIVSESTPYRLGVGFHDGQEGFTHEENGVRIGRSTALLEFNDSVTDTIVAEWAAVEGKSFVIDRIWYNGEEHSSNDVFQIIR